METVKVYLTLIIGLACVLFFGIGAIWCYRNEKRSFNDGFCPKCGRKLEHFDSDSQGGNCYCCSKCSYYTCVSYHSIERKAKKKMQSVNTF